MDASCATAVEIAVRLPAARLSRRFDCETATLRDVRAWVEASLPASLHHALHGRFVLHAMHPRVTLSADNEDTTLAHAGLDAAAVLHFHAAEEVGDDGDDAMAVVVE